jgi:hypothetical protein
MNSHILRPSTFYNPCIQSLSEGYKKSAIADGFLMLPSIRFVYRGEGRVGKSYYLPARKGLPCAPTLLSYLLSDHLGSTSLNRSATICCAVLILLKNLTAEQALERLREHHPWARPDDRHWLKLRWLAKENTAVP